MNPALSTLRKTEEALAALLVTGLSTHRSGREHLFELADDLSTLKIERLSVELRNVAGEQDQKLAVRAAFTALGMSRKLSERLLEWPDLGEVDFIASAADPLVKFAKEKAVSDESDIQSLNRLLEAGHDLLRSHAASLLVERGEAAIPGLTRLASKGTTTVRREAISTIARIGCGSGLRALIDLLGDDDCWRALYEAIMAHGVAAVPLMRTALATENRKGQTERRRALAVLLYRCGDLETLREATEDEDSVVLGLALAAQAESSGRWQELLDPPTGREALHNLSAGMVIMARAEATADANLLIDQLEQIAVNEAGTIAHWMCGSPLEATILEHYVQRLKGGNAKDRQRAVRVLHGLAAPEFVPRLMVEIVRGEVEAGVLAAIIGRAGGSHAAGVLLDMVGQQYLSLNALSALQQLGDPGTAPILLDMLESPPTAASRTRAAFLGAVEDAIVALGESVVDILGSEMRAKPNSARSGLIQQILLQMKMPRAGEYLKGIEVNSVDALLDRIDHPRLGSAAADGLAGFGEQALARLEEALPQLSPTGAINALQAIAATKIKSARTYELIHSVASRGLQNVRDNTELCVRAYEMITSYEEPRNVDLFVQGIASAHYRVRDAAINGLVKSDGEVTPTLMPLLSHQNAWLRAGAIEALGKRKVAAAEPSAVAMLGDQDVSVRLAAATALGGLCGLTCNPQAIDAMGLALEGEKDWSVQRALIDALGDARQRRGIAILTKIEKDPNRISYFRGPVAVAIRKIEEANPKPAREGGMLGKLRDLLGGS